MRGIRRHYRLDRRRIAYFRFILEGYDGLAVLRTVDPVRGLVALHLSASRALELDELLAGISEELRLEPAAPAEDGADDPFAPNHHDD